MHKKEENIPIWPYFGQAINYDSSKRCEVQMGEEPKVATRVQVRIIIWRNHYDNVQVSMEDPMQNFDNVIDLYVAVEELHRHHFNKVK